MPAAMTCLNCPAAFHPPCLPINTPTAGERNVLCASCVQQISSGMRTGRPAPQTRRVGVPPAQVIQETVDQRGAALRQRGDSGDASFVDRLTDGAIAEVMSAVRGGVIAVGKHRRLSNTLGSSSSLEPSDAAPQPPQHGVEQIGVTGLWLSTVRVRGVLRSIGHFGSAAAAARARDLVMLHLWPTTAHATLNFPAGDYAEGSEWMALYTWLKRARGHPVAKSETDSRDVARPPPSAGAEVAGGGAIVSTTQNAVPPALMLSVRVESSIEMASALPDCVQVVCNTVFGLLLTQSMTILTEDAQSKVSIAEFVRRGYGGHLAGGLDLIHVVMEDGAVGSPLDLWVAACSQGSAVVFEVQTGPASEDDGKPKRNGVWTVPAKRRNGRTPSPPAATANGQSRPQQAATVAAEHSTAAINDVQAAMGPEGEGRSLAIFDSAAQPSFNGLGSDDGRGEELESDEERPRKRGRPRRTPQQGEDRAGRQCGYRGVKYMRRRGKWSAFITYHGDLQPLGTFDSEEAAARAYDWAALDLYGRSAVLNFSREEYQTGAPVPSGNIQAESAPIVADSERRSTFMGVYWNAQIGLWSAYATQRGGRRKHRTEIGSFVNEEDAARAYDRHVLETQGPSAITNYPAADYDGLSFAYVGGTMPHLPR
uniref:AP2/ERF domain-containing protein n=1 Tax=Tetraselmis chuii TaxID=63592 RepID=A0A7S1SN43_9CHLO